MPIADLITRPISNYLANLFRLGWVLDRVGYDPCDEWDIDTVLGLPDGLSFVDGGVKFQCRVCEQWSEWPDEVEDFDIDAHENMCGGSPRCCP